MGPSMAEIDQLCRNIVAQADELGEAVRLLHYFAGRDSSLGRTLNLDGEHEFTEHDLTGVLRRVRSTAEHFGRLRRIQDTQAELVRLIEGIEEQTRKT